jgi:hypothetical protein
MKRLILHRDTLLRLDAEGVGHVVGGTSTTPDCNDTLTECENTRRRTCPTNVGCGTGMCGTHGCGTQNCGTGQITCQRVCGIP